MWRKIKTFSKVIAFIFTIIGIAGTPDNLQTWAKWHSEYFDMEITQNMLRWGLGTIGLFILYVFSDTHIKIRAWYMAKLKHLPSNKRLKITHINHNKETDFQKSLHHWNQVNEFTLKDAAYLWCEKSPSDDPLPNSVIARLTVFAEKIRNKQWNADLKKDFQDVMNEFSLVATHQSLTIKHIKKWIATRDSLKQLAISMNEKPKFLFPSGSD